MQRCAFRAMAVTLAGIGLILPMLGVETYMLPVLGRLYLAGQSGLAQRGPAAMGWRALCRRLGPVVSSVSTRIAHSRRAGDRRGRSMARGEPQPEALALASGRLQTAGD